MISISKLLAFALVAGAASSLAGCKEKVSNASTEAHDAGGPRIVKFDPATLERLGVRVEPAGHGSSDMRLQVPGSLEYNLDRYAEIGTIASGRVSQVFVRVGDAVKKGQTLATLLVPSIANAQAEYLGAQAAAIQAKEQGARESGLLEKQLTTVNEAHMAQAQAIQTQATLGAAAAHLQVLGVALPKPGAEINGAGSLTLKSPIDGVVVRRDAVLGAFLDPSEKGFIVADPTELWATVDVYESDIRYFQMGSEVDVTFDALPGKTVKGTVALMEPHVGSASRALRARIAVPNPDKSLKPGLFLRASVKLPDEVAGDAMLLPSAAVQPLGDSDVVFVEREPGQYEVRNVRLGKRTTQLVEIVSGVSRGERVVVEGTFLLRGEVTKQ